MGSSSFRPSIFLTTDMSSSSDITAFSETAANLKRQLEEAAIDYLAFEQTIRPCELSRCKATCCHDGVYLTDEEFGILEHVVAEYREELIAMIPHLPESPFESVAERSGNKTRTRSAQPAELADDYPVHFPKTKCVFLDDQHRCALQRLSLSLNKNPWFYKPITCWMHPVTLALGKRGERSILTLFSSKNDPQKSGTYPGFASCTHCGREDAKGLPASEVLKGELSALMSIGGRDMCF